MRRSFASLTTFALALLLSSTAAYAQSAAVAGKPTIRSLLAAQVDAWNRGDLQSFMSGYWNSPELSFISGTTETRGWQPTLERYRQKYQGEGREMGKLDFFDTRVEMLGPDAAFVTGHWHLQLKDGREPAGVFTLILRKFPEGWRIVHDHTS